MNFDPSNPTPGRYDDLPIDDYHASAGISRSALKILDEGTPRDLQHYLQHGREDTPALLMGRLVDDLVFEPDAVDARYVVKPDFGSTKAELTRELGWYAEEAGVLPEPEGDGMADLRAERARIAKLVRRGVVSDSQDKEARAIAKAVHDAPSVRALLKNIEPQPSYYWEREGLLLKTRPDAISNGYSYDMKSVRSLDRRTLQRSMVDFGYEAQAALAREGMLACGEEWRAHVIVWACKEPPYDVWLTVIEPDDAWLELGEKRWERWFSVYAECMRTNHWPGRSAKLGKLEFPKWAGHRLEEETELEARRLREPAA